MKTKTDWRAIHDPSDHHVVVSPEEVARREAVAKKFAKRAAMEKILRKKGFLPRIELQVRQAALGRPLTDQVLRQGEMKIPLMAFLLAKAGFAKKG